jgi:hypothetical protein
MWLRSATPSYSAQKGPWGRGSPSDTYAVFLIWLTQDTFLGGYGTTHREKSLTDALGKVYKTSIGDTDDEEKPTWCEPDDKRLWNIGPKNGCMMMSSVMVGKEITTARGGRVFLGSEKGAKGQTLEVLARTGVIKSTGLPSLNGCNPVYLQLPLEAPGLGAALASLGIDETIGNNAHALMNNEEKVCDFVLRMAGHFETVMGTLVADDRFKSGAVKRTHRSSLIGGGNDGTIKLDHHPAMKQAFGYV